MRELEERLRGEIQVVAKSVEKVEVNLNQRIDRVEVSLNHASTGSKLVSTNALSEPKPESTTVSTEQTIMSTLSLRPLE